MIVVFDILCGYVFLVAWRLKFNTSYRVLKGFSRVLREFYGFQNGHCTVAVCEGVVVGV